MDIRYIDIHSHLNLSPLSETTGVILSKMQELGVATITVGTGIETSKQAIAIAEENPGQCFATVGIHPCDGADEMFDPVLFETLAHNPNVVAIGETGLDYFREKTDELKQTQTELFEKHIELAQKTGKPLMLHVRASKGSDDAYYDALEILNTYLGASRNFVDERDANFPSVFRSSENRAPTDKEISANFNFFSGSKQCISWETVRTLDGYPSRSKNCRTQGFG